MSELKSCPMCGGAAFVGPLTRKRWFCECEECGVSMISRNDKQAAIDQWNRRAIPADQVLVPRELLSRVEESLRCEIEERYAGTKDHPAIRPKYLRDIAEADELRTLLHP